MFDSDRPTWRNPRVLAILSLVFLCGALCGALTMRVGMHGLRLITPAQKTSSLLSYDKLTHDKELGLRPEQCRQLKTILDDYARFDQDLQSQLEDWHATGKDQILRILDPQQKIRFQRLTEQSR